MTDHKPPVPMTIDDMYEFIHNMNSKNPTFRPIKQFHAIISNKYYDPSDPKSLKYSLVTNIIGSCVAEARFDRENNVTNIHKLIRTFDTPFTKSKLINYFNRMQEQGINIYKIG